MSEGIRSGGELDSFELTIQNAGNGTYQQGFRESGYPDQQTVAPRKYRREDLLDHFILADHDLMQFVHHHVMVTFEFLQKFVKVAFFGSQGISILSRGSGLTDSKC